MDGKEKYSVTKKSGTEGSEIILSEALIKLSKALNECGPINSPELDFLREYSSGFDKKDVKFSVLNPLDPIKKFIDSKAGNKTDLEKILLERDAEGRDLLRLLIHWLIQKHRHIEGVRSKSIEPSKLYSHYSEPNSKEKTRIIGNVNETIYEFLIYVNKKVGREVMEKVINNKDGEDATLTDLLLREFPDAVESVIKFVVNENYLTNKNIPDLLPMAVAACYSECFKSLLILLPKVTEFIRDKKINAGEIAYLQDEVRINNGKIIFEKIKYPNKTYYQEPRQHYDISVVKGFKDILADKTPITIPAKLSLTPLQDRMKTSVKAFIDQVRESFNSDFLKPMPKQRVSVLTGEIHPVTQGNLQGQKSTTCTLL